MNYVDANSKTPRSYQWTLDVQRSITRNFLVDVAYVGNRGNYLFGDLGNVNIPRVGVATASPGIPFQQLRPFYAVDPQLAALKERIFAGLSSYNALQAKLEKRTSRGLSFLASYTYSKTLARGPFGSGNVTAYLDPFNYMAGKYVTPFDRTHMLTVSYDYELPFGRNKEWGKSWNGPTNVLLGGWELGGISTFRTGAPFTPTGNSGQMDNTTSNRPSRVCNGKISNPTISHWFDTSCFVNPAPGSGGAWPNNVYGNSGFDILRGPGFRNWDVTLKKNFPLWSDSRYLQFRAEFYDASNHVNFQNPGGSISVNSAHPDGSAAGGDQINGIVAQPGGLKAREIQFALKLYF